jgi:hypothetical protein
VHSCYVHAQLTLPIQRASSLCRSCESPPALYRAGARAHDEPNANSAQNRAAAADLGSCVPAAVATKPRRHPSQQVPGLAPSNGSLRSFGQTLRGRGP